MAKGDAQPCITLPAYKQTLVKHWTSCYKINSADLTSLQHACCEDSLTLSL